MLSKSIPRGYKQTKVGVIPDDWEVVKLEDISIKKSSNMALNKIENNNGIYPVYGAIGLLKHIDFYAEENNYIAILKDGAGVGRLLYCNAKTSVLGTMDVIKSKKNVSLRFLYLFLHTINFNKYIVGSGIPHIYYKDYKVEVIKLPPIKEQQKIADILSLWDKTINKQQQLNNKQTTTTNHRQRAI